MDTKNPKDKKDILLQIFEIARMIPTGRVTSYGAIAAAIGMKSGARFVGWAMNQSHQYTNIPAHRVLNRNGMLTGKMHFANINTMQQLLEAEAIEVKDDKVLNFDNLFWNPLTEINL